MSFPGDPSSIRRWVEEKLLHPRQASATPPWTLFLGGPMVGRWGTFFGIQVQRPMYCTKGSQVVVMVGGLPTVLSPVPWPTLESFLGASCFLYSMSQG